MVYEWDPEKAARNWSLHAVTFEQAVTAFLDPLAMSYEDPDHSDGEDREVTIGYATDGRLIFISHVLRRNRVRIISARVATRRERKQHEQGLGKSTR